MQASRSHSTPTRERGTARIGGRGTRRTVKRPLRARLRGCRIQLTYASGRYRLPSSIFDRNAAYGLYADEDLDEMIAAQERFLNAVGFETGSVQ